MSDLQLALLALGALIIVLVIGFNWWQERSLRNEASQRFNTPAQDALLDDVRASAPKSDEFDGDFVRSSLADKELLDETPFYIDESEIGQPRFENNPSASAAGDTKTYYEPPTQDVISAVEEFEHDMAQPIPEIQQEQVVEVAAVSTAEQANESDWMQETGFENAQIQSASSAAMPNIVDETAAGYAQSEAQSAASLPATAHQQIDLTALLFLPKSCAGAMLHQSLQAIADLDKPIYVHGLAKDGVWYPLSTEHEATEFIRIACSLQLADRSGAISRQTLQSFQQSIDNIGLQLGAQIEWHGPADPLRYAAELDQFCIDVDVMVGFHLVQGASGPFAGTKFRGLAEAAGLVLGSDGSFQCIAENQPVLYSLVNQDKTPFSAEMLRSALIRGISFQLDIPRVKNSLEVFNRMVLLARQMESSLSANLVDDKQRPLGDTQIEIIRQHLKKIHAKLVARGIVPGSASALRLFS